MYHLYHFQMYQGQRCLDIGQLDEVALCQLSRHRSEYLGAILSASMPQGAVRAEIDDIRARFSH